MLFVVLNPVCAEKLIKDNKYEDKPTAIMYSYPFALKICSKIYI